MASEGASRDLGAQPDLPALGVGALLRFLKGEPGVLHQLACARGTLALGFLFVLSAGLAREYDGEDLLHEPWHALIPLGASLVPSTLLAILTWLALLRRAKARPTFARFFGAMLGAFWMTAPLAWLYAIPWERMTDMAHDAAEKNLLTLGLVAVWRVVLAMRFTRVLAGAQGVGPGVFVIVTSMVLVGLALAALPADVFAIMGGVRIPPKLAVLTMPALFSMACIVYTGWLWVIAALVVYARKDPAWAPPDDLAPRARVGGSLYALAGLVLAIFVGLLPITQPEQLRRTAVERAFKESRHSDAIAELSRHALRDYPPHWEPPGWDGVELIRAADAATRDGVAGWVRKCYVERLAGPRFSLGWRRFRPTLDSAGVAELATLLERLPEGPKIARAMDDEIAWARENPSEVKIDRALLERLRALAKKGEPPKPR